MSGWRITPRCSWGIGDVVVVVVVVVVFGWLQIDVKERRDGVLRDIAARDLELCHPRLHEYFHDTRMYTLLLYNSMSIQVLLVHTYACTAYCHAMSCVLHAKRVFGGGFGSRDGRCAWLDTARAMPIAFGGHNGLGPYVACTASLQSPQLSPRSLLARGLYPGARQTADFAWACPAAIGASAAHPSAPAHFPKLCCATPILLSNTMTRAVEW